MKRTELKRIRLRLRLTQGEMASELKITRGYYNALEKGRRAIKERVETMARLLARNRR